MKSPAFQFYPTDYLASQRVKMMTLEEEGAYINLLCSCWQHGSIPSDPELAARLIGKGASTTLATVVLPMFEIDLGGGRLTHERLERERKKQADWREKSAQGGRNSAATRSVANNKGDSKGGSRVVEPPCQPNGNIPVSSLHTSVKEKNLADAKILLEVLNENSGRSFRAVDAHLAGIAARLSEPGVTPSGIEDMILRQCALWKGTEWEKYLRPDTLFRKSKFAQYYDDRNIPLPKPKPDFVSPL